MKTHPQRRIAYVAGATGMVGRELIKILSRNGSWENVVALVRREIPEPEGPVIVKVVDFGDPGDGIFEEEGGDLFCALGTTRKKAGSKDNFRKVDMNYVLNLAEKAREKHIEKVLVISSMGADPGSLFFYNRVKGEMEAALRELGLPHLFIFRPSLLLGDRMEKRTGERMAQAAFKVLKPLFIGPLKKYRGIEAAQVAKAMVKTAIHSSEALKIFESDEIQDI